MNRVRIGSIVRFYRGVSYKKEQASKAPCSNTVALLRANNINSEKIAFDDLIYVPSELVKQGQYVNVGDIVVTMSSGSKSHVGKVAICNSSVQCSFGAFCGKIEPIGVLPKYLFYILCSKDFRNHIECQCKGTNINNIKQSYILDYEIALPPRAEQERIVSKIEELFSELDKSAETLKDTKAKLEVYRQAVLKEAYKGNWKKIKLEKLCYFITKGTTPSKENLSSTGEIPFIKVYNLTFNTSLDFTIDPTFVPRITHTGFLSRSIVYPGDVLMNIVGPPMGKVSIVPSTYPEWNINQAIARFRCNDNLNNKYLAYYLTFSETIEKMKSKAKATAGQFNLTLEICRNIEIPLPSAEKQRTMVSKIESRLSVCDSIERTIVASLQQAEAMRQSILKQAFEGRL